MAHRDRISGSISKKEHKKVLFQFFAAYFHEDWSIEADTPDQILAKFVRQNDEFQRDNLSRYISAFVHDHPDDRELGEALYKDLGCYYDPNSDGISARSWLLAVAAKLMAREQ